MTWNDFVVEFKEKYYNLSLTATYKEEFNKLKQGDMFSLMP